MTLRDARATAGPAASPSGPGFALRFEAGRGILVLARPILEGPFTLAALELDLGRLPSPVDLRAGAARFRHRRATVLRGEVRIDLDALASAQSTPERRLRRLGDDELVVHTAVRTLVARLVAAHDGRDLLVAVTNARAALEGSAPALVEALTTLVDLGARFEPSLGVVRLIDPVQRVLTELLVPHGWRVPELASVPRHAPIVAGGALVLRVGTRSEISPDVRAVLEEARVVAPVLSACLEQRTGEAARRAADPTPAGVDSDALAALRADLLGVADAWPNADVHRGVALRAALAAGDAEGASAAARALALHERCDDVAIEALGAAANLAAETDAAIAASLAGEALARRPRDRALALAWLDRAGRTSDADALRLGVSALRAAFHGPARFEIVRACAAALTASGSHADARRSWEEACLLAPDDPACLEGLATTLGALGEHEAALAAWDRASDGRAAAGAFPCVQAASHAEALGHLAGAARRLEQAIAHGAPDALAVEALARLSRLRRALGARDAAAESDARLLEFAEHPNLAGLSAALFDAARAALSDGAEPRARACIAALRRIRPGADDRDGGPALRDLESDADALALQALDREAPERSERDPFERARNARAIAERLRASGRLADAARALARAGVIARDAATLRAALDLADKASDAAAALEVISRALEVVGTGPARAFLEARQRSLQSPT